MRYNQKPMKNTIIVVIIIVLGVLGFWFWRGGSGELRPPVTEGPNHFILSVQIGKSVSAFGVTITPQEVLEDSRCATNVVCVWAGRVRLRTMLKSRVGEASPIFILGEPITTGAAEVILTGVEPAPSAGVVIAAKDYRFIFMVKKSGASALGTIQGKVDVGPICPVEREGVPCPVPPEAYTSRQIVIYQTNGTTEVMRKAISADGRYSLALPPGSYVLDIGHQGIDRGSNLPHPFTVSQNQTETFDFSIDTGIR